MQDAVIAASPDYNVSSGLLSAIRRVFQGFVQNERFVDTVKTELLDADRDARTGIATVNSVAVGAALRAAGLSQKPPPVRVEPGVLLGIPPTSGFVDDPICAANGNFLQVDEDLAFPGWAAALGLVRVYNSLAAGAVGAFGPGWSSALDLRIDHVEGGSLRVKLADGAVVPFVGDGPELRAVGARPLRVVVLDDGWVLHEGRTKSWRFDGDGRFVGGVAGPATVVVRRDGDRVVEIVELRSGRRVGFAWSDGRVAAATASDGRVVTYRYDDDGVLIGVDRPSGALGFTVDGNLITSVTDADGVVLARNTYDHGGRVVEQTNELGRTTTYEYSEFGATLASDAVGGPRNAFTHDARGNLTSIVDGTGRVMRLTYDDRDRATTVCDRTGAISRFTYDGRDNLVERLDPDGVGTSWQWDDLDRLVAETHRNGAVTSYEYDGDSRSPAKITGPDGAVTTITHDAVGTPIEVIDPDGVRTIFEWDDDGQLTAIVDALGNRTTFSFDGEGQLISIVDPSGVGTTLRNDHAGRVVEAILADGTCRYSYTAAGRPLRGADGEGVFWRAAYGDHGRVTRFSDAEGSEVGFEWDVLGNVAAVVAPDGSRYLHHHDEAGRLVGAIDPQGNSASRELDAEGRVVRITDAAGRTWTRHLDDLGRTVVAVEPDGARTTYEYHATGSVKTVKKPDGGLVTVEVDDYGRVSAITDESGGRFEMRYTPAGRLLERRYPSGRVEKYSYDDAGRLVSCPGPAGDVFNLKLDPRGRILSRESSRGRVTYDYSDAGELVGVTGPSGSSSAERDRSGRITSVIDGEGNRSHFRWNRRGTLAAASDPSGMTSTFERDIRGRLAAATSGKGEETIFGYDQTGYLRTVSDPLGTLTRLVDATGGVTGVRHADGSGFDRTLNAVGRTRSISTGDGEPLSWFAHDSAGRVTESSRSGASMNFRWTPSGRLGAVEGPSGSVEFDHDQDGFVSGWKCGAAQQTQVERSASGEVIALVDDEAGRVVPPPRPEVHRDRAGRVTATGTGTAAGVYRYDHAGRLVEAIDRRRRTWSFTYGQDGLLAAEEGPLGIRRYHRGILGRLERIDDLDGTVTTFGYDSAGRRTSATRSDGTERRWAWDALGTLIAFEEVGRDGKARRVEIAVDAHGRPYRVGDDPIIWDDGRSGKPLVVGADRFLHLGGRARAAAPTGTWIDPPDDPWGSDTADGPHVGYRNELVAFDLVWMGDRIYDAQTREFLSPDPLMAAPGRPGCSSAYAYGFLDPVNYLDPSGRRPISQAEFDEVRAREEQGRLGQAWKAVTEDPWGTLALVGVLAVGTGLLFVPGGQAFGVGILVGAVSSSALGVVSGSFSPSGAALSGALGAIPGGNSYRMAMASGAVISGSQEIGAQAISGRPIDWGNVFEQAGVGVVTGGITRRIAGARPTVDTPAPPTAPVPRPRPSFAVDARGTAHVVPPPGGVLEVERLSPRPMKPADAVDAWEDFLGPGPHTSTHPRTGQIDPDRLVSTDGTRSIRYGSHEMRSRPARHHYHEETWRFDANLDVWWLDNTLVRVPLP